MRLLIATDFHFGLSRKANFTAESNQRREAVSRQLLQHLLQTPHDVAICVGDVYDRFSNPETVILETAPLLRHFQAVLAGNHDLSNRDDVRGSLDVLSELLPGVVISGAPQWRRFGRVAACFVPHQLTQEAFENALEKVLGEAQALAEPVWKFLFLHCTYDIPHEVAVSSLNLSEARATSLLGAFHKVFLGHEHNPRDLFDDRLHIIGSHFPVAFDQMVDHRHLIFDDETGSLESIVHWRAIDHAYCGSDDTAPPQRQFYDLTSCADARTPLRLFKMGALGVRVRDSGGRTTDLPASEARQTLSLPDQVRALLNERHPKLVALWESVLREITTDMPEQR